jgi:hypothetical protein
MDLFNNHKSGLCLLNSLLHIVNNCISNRMITIELLPNLFKLKNTINLDNLII